MTINGNEAKLSITNISSYDEKLEDIKTILKRKGRNKLNSEEQKIYDFIFTSQNFIEYTKDDTRIILQKGNNEYGFKHLIMRHYGSGADSEIWLNLKNYPLQDYFLL